MIIIRILLGIVFIVSFVFIPFQLIYHALKWFITGDSWIYDTPPFPYLILDWMEDKIRRL
jgi:hypothetical protein